MTGTRKIKISHMSRKVTEKLLEDIFSKSGQVVSVKIKSHRKATLEFHNEDAVYRAIKDFNELKINGKHIRVKKYHRKASREDRKRKSKSKKRSRSKSDEKINSHRESRYESSGPKVSTSKNYRRNEKEYSFKFNDSDRTFPTKNRFKMGKKAKRRMPWKAQQMEQEKKWPSSKFIADFVRNVVPQKGRILGGYYIQPKTKNEKRS